MDIQKAIEWMKSVRAYFDNTFPPVDREAADYIIVALKELEQYREISSHIIEALKERERYKKESRHIIEMLKELEQYRQIGTLDECREAREKQVPKKPEQTGGVVQGIEGIDGCVSYVSVQKDYYECPACGSFLGYVSDCEDDKNYQRSYCPNCGQAIDRSGFLW